MASSIVTNNCSDSKVTELKSLHKKSNSLVPIDFSRYGSTALESRKFFAKKCMQNGMLLPFSGSFSIGKRNHATLLDLSPVTVRTEKRDHLVCFFCGDSS